MAHAIVTLKITGPNLDPYQIQRELRCEGTRLRIPKDRQLKGRISEHAWPLGLWEYSKADVPIERVSTAVMELLRILSAPTVIKDYIKSKDVCICIGVFEPRGNGDSFILESTIIQAMADNNVSVMIDTYGRD
jgi:hypothetical protein